MLWKLATIVAAHLENEVVLENEVGKASNKDEDGWEDCSPQEDDAVGLWQLDQVGDLEACDVIHSKQRQQCLQTPPTIYTDVCSQHVVVTNRLHTESTVPQ